jgi:hypothetical protein
MSCCDVGTLGLGVFANGRSAAMPHFSRETHQTRDSEYEQKDTF